MHSFEVNNHSSRNKNEKGAYPTPIQEKEVRLADIRIKREEEKGSGGGRLTMFAGTSAIEMLSELHHLIDTLTHLSEFEMVLKEDDTVEVPVPNVPEHRSLEIPGLDVGLSF